MELTGIPGVGEKTATALAKLDDPEAAVERGDVAVISQAPGLTPGRAARIARGAIRARYDAHEQFLATERADEIYEQLLGMLQARTITDYGAARLETFFPTASSERIAETRAITEQALTRQPTPDLRAALEGLAPLTTNHSVHIRDRCLATADAERYARLSEHYPELSVEIVDDARGLQELARGYATVIAVDERFAGIDIDGDVRVEPAAIEEPIEVVPERVLSFIAENRATIRAAVNVHSEAALDVPTDIGSISRLLEHIDGQGAPVGDVELDRLTTAVDDFDAAVDLSVSIANDHLRDAIRDRAVTIEGADLLSLVERGASVDSLLATELATEYDQAIEAATKNFVDALSLTTDEAAHVDRLFPDSPSFPVEANSETGSRLREELRAARDRQAASVKRELARRVVTERDAIETMVQQALALDVELAIRQFSDDFGCSLPEMGGTGISITGGRSPLLAESLDEIEPIDYTVTDVVVLSGVNSGGKTSVLDLVASVVILAHMGLPVPADQARVQRFEALHYHAATQGTLDAGAFEATLTSFAELVEGPTGRLVLVDELESITEPGAAATIVAGILDELQGAATAIFVSHLATEIHEAVGPEIRIDGIAATGVVDGELIVERTPVRDHLARSTPELLIESLASETTGSTAEFYEKLLQKFD